MNNIVIIIFAFVAGMISISQFLTCKDCNVNKRTLGRYQMLTLSLTFSALLSIIMILTYGTQICFFFYGLDRIFEVLVMVAIIRLTRVISGVDKKVTSFFVSFVLYSSIILLLLDTLMIDGHLSLGKFGVYFYPQAPIHRALYFVYYLAYIIIVMFMFASKGMNNVHRRDGHDLMLLGLVYGTSAFGFLAEIFMINFKVEFVDLSLYFNLISAIIMMRLLKYHEFISIRPDKFKEELDDSRTDIVFILDERLNIIYQNKRAEVIGQIVNDNYLGRCLSDVFVFSDNALGQISFKPDGIPFGMTANYLASDRQVNLVIEHRLDNYNEIMCTVVYVYNMEESTLDKNSESVEINENDEQLIESALNVTSEARALIIDDDVLFLNVLTRLLKRYKIVVSRALNREDALEQVTNNVFDIIFVSYDNKKMDVKSIVETLRHMDGEYYSQVPVVFITESNINDVFSDFINIGINDYLGKPINHKILSQVLTRWLWQRFEEASPQKAQVVSTFNEDYVRLSELIDDAIIMYKNDKMDKFLYCIGAINRICDRISLNDFADLSYDIMESIVIEEYEIAKQSFERLIMAVRDINTLKA